MKRCYNPNVVDSDFRVAGKTNDVICNGVPYKPACGQLVGIAPSTPKPLYITLPVPGPSCRGALSGSLGRSCGSSSLDTTTGGSWYQFVAKATCRDPLVPPKTPRAPRNFQSSGSHAGHQPCCVDVRLLGWANIYNPDTPCISYIPTLGWFEGSL